jgi:hypothetical protein
MGGCRPVWVLSLPLAAAGLLTAHAAAYYLVGPPPAHRHQLHGYLGYTEAIVGTGVLVALFGLVVLGARCARARPPAVLFGALPVVGFVVQEHVERLVQTGTFPVTAALEMTFLVGLVLQLPFAFAALVAARALLALGGTLASAPGRSPRLPVTCLLPAPAPEPGPPRISVLARGHAGRGPPRVALEQP